MREPTKTPSCQNKLASRGPYVVRMPGHRGPYRCAVLITAARGRPTYPRVAFQMLEKLDAGFLVTRVTALWTL